MIDRSAWAYVTKKLELEPRLVFCHPDVLRHDPRTSLYYRGLSGLSLKAAKDYCGALESLESGRRSGTLDPETARTLARAYNTFICSVINGSAEWTLDNGFRTIVATIGISVDGSNRNKIGDKAEQLVRTLVVGWLLEHDLIVEPSLTKGDLQDSLPTSYSLRGGITMCFGSEPDIAFRRDGKLIGVVEIKGGTDPAGALERYGAAKKSFESAVAEGERCKNFYLAAVLTTEVNRRIAADRLVEKAFSIIDILEKKDVQESFFDELFNHALRLT